MPSKSYESIESLCLNYGLNGLNTGHRTEPELVKELTAILTANPEVANETDDYGMLLLHLAVCWRSVEFCKVLVEKNPQAVRTADDLHGQLPFHYSCSVCKIDVAKYLLELYPESIYIRDGSDSYPIHCFLSNISTIRDDVDDVKLLEFTAFLLQLDQGALSVRNDFGGLPLHLACSEKDLGLPSVVLIFNAYPEAVFARYGDTGRTPWDEAIDVVVEFVESQLELVRQAREDTVPDYYGCLPIHRVLHSANIPEVGTIKLMLAANPSSTSMTNNSKAIPLHIACLSGNLNIVMCLVEANENSLRFYDMKRNAALHIACLAGKTDVINYILNKSDHGISVQNADGDLPIQLLLFQAKCNRSSFEYMNAVYSLLRACPAVLMTLGIIE